MDSMKKISVVPAASVSQMDSGDPIASIMKDNSKNQKKQQKGKKAAAALLGILLGSLTIILIGMIASAA